MGGDGSKTAGAGAAGSVGAGGVREAGSSGARRLEALISGFGGQGVVTCGRALGLAAVKSGLEATMLVSHGTETRGGYVRSQVVVSDAGIDSPAVERPDLLCCLSQAAWLRFSPMVADGIAIYDPDLVDPDWRAAGSPGAAAAGGAAPPLPGPRRLALPARALAASELGTPLAANMVALGAMVRLSAMVDLAAAEEAVGELSRRGREVNLAALRLGSEAAGRLAETGRVGEGPNRR